MNKSYDVYMCRHGSKECDERINEMIVKTLQFCSEENFMLLRGMFLKTKSSDLELWKKFIDTMSKSKVFDMAPYRSVRLAARKI